MRNGILVSTAGWLATFFTMAGAYFVINEIIPAEPTNIVWGSAAVLLTLWAISLIHFTISLRRGQDIRRQWLVTMGAILNGISLLSAASLWLLLPHIDEALRLFLVILLLGYVTTLTVAFAERPNVALFANITVLGSVTIWYLFHGGRMALPVSIWAVQVMLFLAAFRSMLARQVREARTARAAVETANGELQQALAKVAAVRDAKTRFIAAASHDLAQPVQAARLFFEASLVATDKSERDSAADGVRTALSSASAQLDQMLDHLRLEAGAVKARPQILAIKPLIARVAATYQQAATAAGMRLRVAGADCQVCADELLLERALSNLTANAIKHSGGETIVLGVRQNADVVRLWVIDDGRGISTSDREWLFEDYTRGPGVGPGGFGIGLASTRRGAIEMGGYADIDTRWVGGCAFWIELPAAKSRRAIRLPALSNQAD